MFILVSLILLAGVVLLALLTYLYFVGLRANEVDWGGRVLNAIDGLNRLFCRRYHQLNAASIPLPAEGPVLLVSNHVSGLDPLLLLAASPRPLHFIIASEQYHRTGLTWLFRRGGCIPVDRRGRVERAFRAALKALEEGKVVALFPQGQIHHGKKPPPRLKRGVAKLAELSGAPVYPVRISGVRGEGHTLLAPLIRSQVSLIAYAPVDCAAIGQDACMQELVQRLNN